MLALTAAGLLAARPAPAVQVPTDFVNETIVPGLDEPNSFAFLPDGRLLITEQRTGNVRMIVNGHIAATDPVFTVPLVNAAEGEQGLQGIAIDPDWPSRPFVYLFYNRQGGAMRLVRYLADGDVENPNGETLTLSSQRILIDDIADLNGNHNGGGLRFGLDRRLYVSLGEDAFPCGAADSTSLRGEILRLEVDGLPIYGGPQVPRAWLTPPDNPFAASPDSNARLVYAFGLRNPWRFHIDPVLGTLYTCDVGQDTYEEIDEVAPGDFLGWPYREANFTIARPECPEPGGVGAMHYRHPIASEFHGGPFGYAILSASMYRPVSGAAHNWPRSYYPSRGDLFYSDYYSGYLRRLTFGGASWGPAPPVPGQPSATDWAQGLTTPVDFLVGPDGSLWWLSQFNSFYDPSSGAVYRIRYTGPTVDVGGARPPSAAALRATPNPFRATADLSFYLATPGHVRLAIYDLAGRRVRGLHDGFAPAGDSRLMWDGTSDRGARASAGLYFARLEREGSPPVVEHILRLR